MPTPTARECELRIPIDKCEQGPPITLANGDVFEAGQIEDYGTPGTGTETTLFVCAAAGDGVTQRDVDTAAGKLPRPGLVTPLIRIPDCVVPKLAADDSIVAGKPLWFSVDDSLFVSALNKVDNTGVCFQCAWALEDSNDPADTIRVTFDGRGVTGEAGTL